MGCRHCLFLARFMGVIFSPLLRGYLAGPPVGSYGFRNIAPFRFRQGRSMNVLAELLPSRSRPVLAALLLAGAVLGPVTVFAQQATPQQSMADIAPLNDR